MSAIEVMRKNSVAFEDFWRSLSMRAMMGSFPVAREFRETPS